MHASVSPLHPQSSTNLNPFPPIYTASTSEPSSISLALNGNLKQPEIQEEVGNRRTTQGFAEYKESKLRRRSIRQKCVRVVKGSKEKRKSKANRRGNVKWGLWKE